MVDEPQTLEGGLPAGEGLVSVASTQRFDLPYPGLRSFERSEAQLFFGRDRCVDTMVETLDRTGLLAVLGPSGSGKSSLVRTGLYEALEAGLARSAGSHWVMADIKHPGAHPFRELARALLATKPVAFDDQVVDQLGADLRKAPEKLADWWQCQPDSDGMNLLILVDQFEELFRQDGSEDRDRLEAFVDLLLVTVAQPTLSIYIVLTMRSEYLGAAALVPGLAEAINRSLALTPRMTRGECHSAIVGPSRIVGFEIEPKLVNELLNDMSDLAPWEGEGSAGEGAGETEIDEIDRIARRADQLPLMQHVLNLLWAKAPRPAGCTPVLTQQAYHAEGRLQGALDKHATDVMDKTRDPATTERLFRALTSGSSVATAVRRQRTIGKLIDETGCSLATLRPVIDAFRAKECNFLTVTGDGELRAGDTVDISHESLIRQWRRLSAWVVAEAEAGRTWRDLRRAALNEESEGLLSGKLLEAKADWLRRQTLPPGWIARYDGEEDRVRDFVKRSEVADRKNRRRARVLALSTVGALILAAVISVVVFIVMSTKAKEASSRENRAIASEAASKNREAEAKRRETQARQREESAVMRSDNALKIQQAALASARMAAARERAAKALELRARQAEASAKEQTAKLAEQSQQLALQMRDEVLAPRIRAARKMSQQNAATALNVTTSAIAKLENASPVIHSALAREIEATRGTVFADDFDIANTIESAQRLEEEEQLGAASLSPDERALRAASAAILRGRAALLEGDAGGAAGRFRSGADGLTTVRSEDALSLIVEARFLEATALLRAQDPAGAATAATACLDALAFDASAATRPAAATPAPDAEESEARDADVNTGQSVRVGQCLTIRAATLPDGPEAEAAFEAAARQLKDVPTSTPELIAARAELLVRYYRRNKRPVSAVLPILEAQNSFLYDVRQLDGSDLGMPRAEALTSMDAIAEIARQLVAAGNGQDAASLLLRLETLYSGTAANLPEDLPVEIKRRLTSGFLDQLALRRDTLKLELPELFDNYAQFLLTGLPRRLEDFASFVASLPEPEKLASIARARALAADLLRAAAPSESAGTYGDGSLSTMAEELVGKLCDRSDLPRTAECDDLTAQAGLAGERETKLLAGLRSAGGPAGSPVPLAWLDRNGVALGGIDPLSCSGTSSSGQGLGWLNNFTPRRTVANSGEAAIDSCYLERGRYKYHRVLGKQLFLFASKDNQDTFAQDPDRYGPALRGYDVVNLAEGRVCRPSEKSYTSGYAYQQRVYLSASFKDVTPAIITQAEAEWAKLGGDTAGPTEAEECE